MIRGDNRVDLPVSPLIGHLVRHVERHRGTATVSEMARDIAVQNGVPPERVQPPLLEATRLLLRDGVLVAGDHSNQVSH